jgi:glucose/mannose-6-phosphate isomerase
MNSILDDLKRIADVDKEGMCKIVERFPEQCKDAIDASRSLTIPKRVRISDKISIKFEEPRNIVVVGMGGSAIAGNLLKDWLRNKSPIPIDVCRSYHLPAYVDKKTLVLVVSYSGNTEETLSAYLDALEKECMTIVFTSGGLLQQFSETLGVPLVPLPPGYPPRSAVAYLFFPLAYSLGKMKPIHSLDEEIQEIVPVVSRLRDEIKPETPVEHNLAKKLAIGLKGSVPLICGFDLYKSVALRMKTQFNENSKTPAKVEFFPELNHNETVGWTGSKDLTSNFSIVLIRDDQEPAEIGSRIDVTRNLVFEKRAEILEIYARGEGRLARMLSAMYIGDFASIYLAILYQMDPTPVTIIDELKRRLADRGEKRQETWQRFKKLTV